jgi:hypothetical protein
MMAGRQCKQSDAACQAYFQGATSPQARKNAVRIDFRVGAARELQALNI